MINHGGGGIPNFMPILGCILKVSPTKNVKFSFFVMLPKIGEKFGKPNFSKIMLNFEIVRFCEDHYNNIFHAVMQKFQHFIR